MAEKSVLLCPLIIEQPTPKRPEAVRHHCDECKMLVWIMPENISLPMDKLCRHCNQKYVDQCRESGEPVMVFPASVARKRQEYN